MPYNRILLKLSGDLFSGKTGSGLDFEAIQNIANEIIDAHKERVEIAVVNGAGNIFRGRNRPDTFDRVSADHIGFMAGIPNSLALLETLNANGIDTRIMCSFEIPGIARHFDPFKARRLLSEGKIVIFTGGTGDAFFTHDTASVLKALEIKADALFKATDVDGVYSDDPQTNRDATRYATLAYEEAIAKNLRILDQTAFTLARENELPIVVFGWAEGMLAKVLKNPSIGTVIS